MKQYRYSLDKSSKKYPCPKCNQKTFVRYIDNEMNTYLSEDFGRCDREENCRYHKKPNSVLTDIQYFDYEIIEKPNPSYHTTEEFRSTLNRSCSNYFSHFLKSVFPKELIDEVIDKYNIGTCDLWNGNTVFWQKDNQGKIRAGKIMLYNHIDGKRLKSNNGKPRVNWMHKYLNNKNFIIDQCLFGLHLLDGNLDKIIGLVESEKTAIIMSLAIPEIIWMATGGNQNFKEKLLYPLREYKVVAFPDKSEYDKWNSIANELNDKEYRIIVSDFVEKSDYENGADLADIFLDQFKKDKGTIPEVIKNSKIRYLKDAFDCSMDIC